LPFYEIALRLLLAAVCSAAVGFEREAAQKAAGLRTHTLVGLGSAIFAIVSIVGFEGPDESRIAAQVVTGIGFLGAGAIFREGTMVTGLTTAAGLWTVAAIGLAAGSGSYVLAVLGTVAVVTVFVVLRAVDAAVFRRLARTRPALRIHIADVASLNGVLKFVKRLDEDAEQVDFKRTDEVGCAVVVVVDPGRAQMISEMLSVHKSVERVETMNPLYLPPD
jgi:putative Mg2+ transporter-C (MgtC) family protein